MTADFTQKTLIQRYLDHAFQMRARFDFEVQVELSGAHWEMNDNGFKAGPFSPALMRGIQHYFSAYDLKVDQDMVTLSTAEGARYLHHQHVMQAISGIAHYAYPDQRGYPMGLRRVSETHYMIDDPSGHLTKELTALGIPISQDAALQCKAKENGVTLDPHDAERLRNSTIERLIDMGDRTQAEKHIALLEERAKILAEQERPVTRGASVELQGKGLGSQSPASSLLH